MSGYIMSQVKDEQGGVIYDALRLILGGKKTQTRRKVRLLADGTGQHGAQMIQYPSGIKSLMRHDANKDKWVIEKQVGRKYAVVPKRAMPQVFYRYHEGELQLAHETFMLVSSWVAYARLQSTDWKAYLCNHGWTPLYIRIMDLRIERLQDISEADALSEGCNGLWNPAQGYGADGLGPKYTVLGHLPTTEYKHLWERINGNGSWDINPLVTVHEFEVV